MRARHCTCEVSFLSLGSHVHHLYLRIKCASCNTLETDAHLRACRVLKPDGAMDIASRDAHEPSNELPSASTGGEAKTLSREGSQSQQDGDDLREGMMNGRPVQFIVKSFFVSEQLERLKSQIAALRRLRTGERFLVGRPEVTPKRPTLFSPFDAGVASGMQLDVNSYFTNAEWMYAYREMPLFASFGDLRMTTAAQASFGRKRDLNRHAELRLGELSTAELMRAEDVVESETNRRLRTKRAEEIAMIAKELQALGVAEQDDSARSARRQQLTIRERSLKLADLQIKVRNNVVAQQQLIMHMPERAYKKMIKDDMKVINEKKKKAEKKGKAESTEMLRNIAAMRKRMNQESSTARDERTARNRAVVKYHDKMLRNFARKARDENSERMLRLEALKANDLAAYRELLAEAKGREKDIAAGGEGDKYEALTQFLEATESYLTKLGGKIAAVKIEQARSEAASAAASEAEAKGFSEEEVKAIAEEAAKNAALIDGEAILDGAADGEDTKERYYAMAHSTQEIITHQPRMLTFGQLRDYQIVSLQWMISLYNNRLNGILADEMGLGKTVQVCALIAYLFESKQNFGPHLIIVPNAVIVNWKAEIKRWLPRLTTVFYVGSKDTRAKIFQQKVLQLKFNILVTSYEFIMRDRAKLSKVAWKYIIIDEAQRLKDREGRLSRDLDRFRAQRRLLLTGTPLQNDLSELWSLLNLLLPEVFDSSKVFREWFGSNKAGDQGEDGGEDWIEREKKVIVISRLHQILEPFMLRRLVQDVERKLPPRVTVVIHCPFSAFQSSVYDWVRKTASIRVEPGTRMGLAAQQNFRGYLPIQNRCMELRKLCNHPSLSYPPERGGDFRGPNLVRACGKLWILDRLLIKLQRSGHRVLLFCTMTKLLDLLEVYLQWRWSTPDGKDLKYCRIDGMTSLEQREIAINAFNAPHSDKFIFLLSIRAAGRGLNLQTADTVVVYDPDPNPKNEEQAIARAHRIGQTREVRVIHFESVDDAPVEKLDAKTKEAGWGGPNRAYCESLESSVRNVIQQQKIEMAAEIVDAGRFDGQTTHAERRETLENLLQSQANGKRAEVNVPPLSELNRQMARSEEEWQLFNRLDEELDWPGALMSSSECPPWIRYTQDEIDQAIFANSKAAKSSVTDIDESLGRGARSTGNLKNTNSAVWSQVDRVEGDFVDRTGILVDKGEQSESEEVIQEESVEDIGDIEIEGVWDEDEDDDDTATVGTVDTQDDSVDEESNKAQTKMKFTLGAKRNADDEASDGKRQRAGD